MAKLNVRVPAIAATFVAPLPFIRTEEVVAVGPAGVAPVRVEASGTPVAPLVGATDIVGCCA